MIIGYVTILSTLLHSLTRLTRVQAVHCSHMTRLWVVCASYDTFPLNYCAYSHLFSIYKTTQVNKHPYTVSTFSTLHNLILVLHFRSLQHSDCYRIEYNIVGSARG